MEIMPYESDHLKILSDFGGQEYLKPHLKSLTDARYEDRGPAFSGIIDGRIIGCAGLVEAHQYRAHVWAVLSRTDKPQQFVAIHKAVVRFLDNLAYKRIDAHVAFNDPYGHRWAAMLGFTREVYCRAWALPDGSSVTEYVRWRK